MMSKHSLALICAICCCFSNFAGAETPRFTFELDLGRAGVDTSGTYERFGFEQTSGFEYGVRGASLAVRLSDTASVFMRAERDHDYDGGSYERVGEDALMIDEGAYSRVISVDAVDLGASLRYDLGASRWSLVPTLAVTMVDFDERLNSGDYFDVSEWDYLQIYTAQSASSGRMWGATVDLGVEGRITDDLVVVSRLGVRWTTGTIETERVSSEIVTEAGEPDESHSSVYLGSDNEGLRQFRGEMGIAWQAHPRFAIEAGWLRHQWNLWRTDIDTDSPYLRLALRF